MPVTNYYTVNGQIIGEQTVGGSRIDYLTDVLGSVIATVNQSGQVVNTYRYKPSGALLAKTGTGPDPSFGWVGSQGYRQTGRKFSDFYVRARHDDSTTGRWTTKDPIGLDLGEWNLYFYVWNNPTSLTDPSGLRSCQPQPCCTQADIDAYYQRLNRAGACQSGVWDVFNPTRDNTACDTTRDFARRNKDDARHLCAAVAERLKFLKKACEGQTHKTMATFNFGLRLTAVLQVATRLPISNSAP